MEPVVEHAGVRLTTLVNSANTVVENISVRVKTVDSVVVGSVFICVIVSVIFVVVVSVTLDIVVDTRVVVTV